MFASPVGQVFGVARYFDLSADEWFDVIQVQRMTTDVDIALTLGPSGVFRPVTIATETLELAMSDLYSANIKARRCRSDRPARYAFLCVMPSSLYASIY